MPARPVSTSRRVYTHRDALGVEINRNDTVMVTAWGTARLVDTGVKSAVLRIGPKRIVIVDIDGYERAVNPRELTVMRRDGGNGFEGNKPKVSPWGDVVCRACGGVGVDSCICGTESAR